MFDWQTFWHYHRRRWWARQKPSAKDGVKNFAKSLLLWRPAKGGVSDDGSIFGKLAWWLTTAILVLLCWKVMDWLVPTTWVFTLLLAFALLSLIRFFVARLLK